MDIDIDGLIKGFEDRVVQLKEHCEWIRPRLEGLAMGNERIVLEDMLYKKEMEIASKEVYIKAYTADQENGKQVEEMKLKVRDVIVGQKDAIVAEVRKIKIPKSRKTVFEPIRKDALQALRTAIDPAEIAALLAKLKIIIKQNANKWK